ncbi:MAG: hypothetical protein ABSB67_12180 [Bryobacteraceae bacterium]
MIGDEAPREIPDDPPPILGAWPRVYAAVAAYVAVVIFLFWLFTRAFAE